MSEAQPGPDRSGPGFQVLLLVARDMLGAALRLSWPAVVMALGVYAYLQGTRIALWNRMRGELRSANTLLMEPVDIAHFAGWWTNANELALRDFHAVNWAGVVRRYLQEQPLATAQFAVVCLGASYALALALVTLIAVRGARSRLVPFELTWRDRVVATSRAVRSATPWCVVTAVLISATCWHVGYDRLGRSRLLIDVLPSPVQGLVIMAMWAVCALLLLLYFLAPHAKALGAVDARVCPRCRYSLRGLSGRPCPECGSEQLLCDTARIATVREKHLRLLSVLAIGLAGMALVGAALAAGTESVANWARLRPATIPWVLDPDQCVLGESPSWLKTIYGSVSLRAQRASEIGERDWIIVWERQAGTIMKVSDELKELEVSLHSARTPASAVMVETPSGPIWLWQPENSGPLFFGFPEVIVTGK